MTTEQAHLMMLKGMVSELPLDQQEKIRDFKRRFEEILAEDEDNAALAMGMIGLERSDQ